MTLLYVTLILVLLGFVCWFIDNKLPVNQTIKTITFGVIIIWVIWWVGSLFNMFTPPPFGIINK